MPDAPRLEASEVTIEGGLAGSVPGRILHDQRRVDGYHAVVADVRRHRLLEACVVLRGAEMQQPAVGVDDGDAALVDFSPGKVDANKVHLLSLPHPDRKL